MEHHFTWISLIPGLRDAPPHVVHALMIAFVLVLTTLAARAQLVRAMATQDGAIVPEPRMTYRNFFEIVAEALYKFCENVLGEHDAPTYYPFIGSLFVFIFVSNIVGLIPGFLPPTDNLNTTMALGLVSFVYYNYAGLRANGLSYLKHFLGPLLWLAPLMVVIEIASHLFRPLSLGLRLRGNIFADHIVAGAFTGLVPYLLPVVFYGLGAFVAFVQAFVFCLMTMVYISLGTAHDH